MRIPIRIRLFNRCRKCGKVDRGVVEKWPGKPVWHWTCPHCLTPRIYPHAP